MCTVTIVRHAGRLRVACNRDEQRTRPAARPPQLREVDGMPSLWPVDPATGGTWVAVNGAGVVMALLNRTPRSLVGQRLQPSAPSRGLIIPALLACDSLPDVLDCAAALPLADFPLFTLVAVHGSKVAVLRNMPRGLAVRRQALDAPILFTSSSLGDHLVGAPRRALFSRLLARSPSALDAQRIFHDHCWPDRPEISVRMSRADAATMSQSVVEIDRGRAIAMTYRALPHHERITDR